MRSDIVPGAVRPDLEPPDMHGTRRRQSKLQDGDPIPAGSGEAA